VEVQSCDALAMPPSFAEAIHLVSSDSAMGCILQAGGRRARIHGSGDRLTSGPCDVDPVRHEDLRRAWDNEGSMPGFRYRLGLEKLRALVSGNDPVVLWGTRAFSDLVWLWWALDGLRRVAGESPRFYLARPRPCDPLESTGGSTPEEARIALANAQPITIPEWREGAELWLQYASPSPLAFDEARQRGSGPFPELTSSADLHGGWFPRGGDARLRLSELDEILLRGTDHSWRTTYDVLQALPQGQLARLMTFDSFFGVDRLCAWAEHGVLEREVVIEDNPYACDRFRATSATRRLLEQGLDGVSDAPPLYVGGCAVNDPASPWVRIEHASGWRLVLDAAV
jgi:hypothetical protein